MKKSTPYNYDYIEAAKILESGSINDGAQDKELEACMRTYEIIDEMQDIERFETNEAWNKLHDRIEKSSSKKKVYMYSNRMNMLWKAAAAITIVIGIGSMILWMMSGNETKMLTAENYGMQAKIIELADGSKVALNKDAVLKYPKVFSENERKVTLSGEGFFEVAPNAEKPFQITAGNAKVTVLGTSFNVNEKGNNVEVIVATGKVELSYVSNGKKNIILTPGNKGTLHEHKLIHNANTDINYKAWADHKLIFKAAPLSVVVNDLNKTYHSQIELGSSDLESLQITTTFLDQPLDEVVASIALALELNINKSGKKYILEN